MFERVREIEEAVATVFALASALKRGRTLKYAAISGATGLAPNEGRWAYVCAKAMRRMEQELQVTCLADQGRGIRLLTVDEQIAEMERRARKARRQMKRGRRSAACIPAEAMTMHQRRVRSAGIELARQMESRLGQSIRDQIALRRKTPTIPRNRPVAEATMVAAD